MLQDKKIVIGVCGGIAAYKAVELVSLLKKAGAQVSVMMTQNAQQFVSRLTFQTISQNTVYDDMFRPVDDWDVTHISLAKEKDLFVLIPATANVIGKIAGGIADDFLTTAVMATKSKVLIAPAMNTNMYQNPIVAANIEKLKEYGYFFSEPVSGNLACGDTGVGKLAPVEQIFEEIVQLIAFPKDLRGVRVLVTAGPTKEYIDPVRFISNDSSGKMGYAVARAAQRRGADVMLVCGQTTQAPVPGVKMLPVISADEMYDAVLSRGDSFDIIVKAAAVSDFKVTRTSEHKLKKNVFDTLRLTENPDILKAVSLLNRHAAIVGFCMETRDLIESAKKKLAAKNADLIVANDLSQEGAGFGVDTNIVKIVDASGAVEEIPKTAKEELAHHILDRTFSVFCQKNPGHPAAQKAKKK